jgi:hypothetical protein
MWSGFLVLYGSVPIHAPKKAKPIRGEQQKSPGINPGFEGNANQFFRATF